MTGPPDRSTDCRRVLVGGLRVVVDSDGLLRGGRVGGGEDSMSGE